MLIAADPDSLDILPLRLAQQIYRIAQGRHDLAEIEQLRELVTKLEDRDIGSSMHDLDGTLAFVEGRWADAARHLQRVVTRLGGREPEIVGWVETARATFERLGAAPLRALLDAALEAEPRSRPSTTATPAVGEAAGTTGTPRP